MKKEEFDKVKVGDTIFGIDYENFEIYDCIVTEKSDRTSTTALIGFHTDYVNYFDDGNLKFASEYYRNKNDAIKEAAKNISEGLVYILEQLEQ